MFFTSERRQEALSIQVARFLTVGIPLNVMHGLAAILPCASRILSLSWALADLGLLTDEEYGDATARLLGMEFVMTQFDSSSLISDFNLASWSPSRWPAAQVLRTFSNPPTDLMSLFKIFVQFAIRLYRESITPETKCSIPSTFLDIFSERPEGMPLIAALRRSSNALFGINAVGHKRFEECFDRWDKR